MKNKKVSICIPIFYSEPYLEECLRSVALQSFKDFEVIVVNDGSKGIDSNGNSCKKIVKNAMKEYKIDITYIEHNENKGLLEARRTAIYEAKGDYILNLDSDDKLYPECLEVLVCKANSENADIVQGKASLFNQNQNERASLPEGKLKNARNKKLEKITNVYLGNLENQEILDGYLVSNNHSGFLWGKLFKRELYLEAFDKIQPMFCTLAEDVIQYFWLCYFAKKYVGIDKCIYYYCDDTGVTSNKVIDSLNSWEHVCSVASVFSSIYTNLQEGKINLSEAQLERLGELCCSYVANNLDQLNGAVVSELKEEAYNMLCDYWGEDFVHTIEKQRQNKR